MRRVLAVLVSCLCAATPGVAQDRPTLPLVAVLRVNTADTVEPGQTLFRNALATLGRVDGKHLRDRARCEENRCFETDAAVGATVRRVERSDHQRPSTNTGHRRYGSSTRYRPTDYGRTQPGRHRSGVCLLQRSPCRCRRYPG